MQSASIRFLTVVVAALAFWELANVVLRTQEPWDSPDYLTFYLSSLGLCAAFGYFFGDRSWRWGLIVIFAQLPVMVFHAGVGPLLGVGLLFLTIQSLPAIMAATAASKLRELQRRS